MDALIRGDAATRTITILDGNEEALDLTGVTIVFTARRRIGDAALITKSTADGITIASPQSGATKGKATIAFVAADTSALENYRVDLHVSVVVTIGGLPYTSQVDVLTVQPR